MIRKDEPAPPAPEPKTLQAPQPGLPPSDDGELFEMGSMEGLSMADLLGPDPSQRGQAKRSAPTPKQAARSVDDFDFDEEAFLAALDDHEPHGTTGEVVRGTVIGMESDGAG